MQLQTDALFKIKFLNHRVLNMAALSYGALTGALLWFLTPGTADGPHFQRWQ